MTSESGHATGSALDSTDWVTIMRHGSRAWARYGVIWALLLVLLCAWLIYPGFFATVNITNMLVVSAPDGFVAVGMTILILSGAFDLSAGATLSLCAVIYAGLSNQMPLALAALLTLALGAGAGLMNGSIVTLLRVNPFVATLGTSSAIAGAALLYTGGEPITVNKPSFQTLGNGTWFGIPISAVLLLVFAIVAGVTLSYTRFGRAVYAVGGNSVASRLCGIRVGAMRVSCYIAVGLCAAVGGMVVGSTLGVVEANVGVSTSLNAIAIVVVGGTSLLGGEGAMWRTGCGFLILATIENVLDAKAVSAAWQGIVTGCIIVAAVAVDMAAGQLHLHRSRRLAGRAVVDASSVEP